MSTQSENSRINSGKKPEVDTFKASILLAEDDQEMRAMLKRILEQRGYEVETCEDGVELLQHFGSFSNEKLPRQFDLIVSDIRMPGFTGMEILDFVHDNGGFPPIMLITAFGDQKTHAEAENLGAVAMLDKPFDIDDFVATVANILKRKAAGKLKEWKTPNANVDVRWGFPIEVLFHKYPEIEDVKDMVYDRARLLKSSKVRIIYCRVIISEQHHSYEANNFVVKIILTIPGKVFLAENSPFTQDPQTDMMSVIGEQFQILHGKLEKYINEVRNDDI